MSNQKLKAEQFRALHVAGYPLILFNIWDAGSAKAVAAAGAKALATGSWSVAAANGFADGERCPFDVALDNLQRIVKATDLPVSIDLESGYGSDPVAVQRTITRAIAAGAIGCNLEDSHPQTNALRDIAEQIGRITHARRGADEAGVPFFLNARTDVFLIAPRADHASLLTGALERGRAFSDAGADGFFLPGLVDAPLIALAVEESPLPVNVMMSDALPPVAALAQLGVARISHGPRPYLAMMKSLETAARMAMNQDSTR